MHASKTPRRVRDLNERNMKAFRELTSETMTEILSSQLVRSAGVITYTTGRAAVEKESIVGTSEHPTDDGHRAGCVVSQKHVIWIKMESSA
jgi:hypothetical protein